MTETVSTERGELSLLAKPYYRSFTCRLLCKTGPSSRRCGDGLDDVAESGPRHRASTRRFRGGAEEAEKATARDARWELAGVDPWRGFRHPSVIGPTELEAGARRGREMERRRLVDLTAASGWSTLPWRSEEAALLPWPDGLDAFGSPIIIIKKHTQAGLSDTWSFLAGHGASRFAPSPAVVCRESTI